MMWFGGCPKTAAPAQTALLSGATPGECHVTAGQCATSMRFAA